MANRRVQLDITADASNLRENVTRAAQAASDAIQGIGKTSEEASKNVERNSNSIVAALKRQATETQKAIAETKTGDRASAQFFEEFARQKKVDVEAIRPLLTALSQLRTEYSTLQAQQKQTAGADAFLTSLKQQAEAIGKTRSELAAMQAARLGLSTQAEPFIAKLRESEAALKKAGIAFNEYGLSAKQTTAALRQVPAQITDIVVSLQGGQAPLTVLLQQGGQLRDVFGGIVPAARALSSALLGMINPFTIIAGTIGVIAAGFIKGTKELNEFSRTLILTGNAVGSTVPAMRAMADEIARMSGSTTGTASEALAKMAQSARVAGADLLKFTSAAVNLEKVGGPAIEKTVDAFADLGRAPLQASLKLNEATNYLTESTYKQIKALEEQGRTVEAARVAQNAYADSINQRTPQIVEQLGWIQQAWREIAKVSRTVLDNTLKIGAPSDFRQQIAETESAIERVQRLNRGGGGGLIGRLFGDENELRAQLAAQKEALNLLERFAAKQQEVGENNKARIAFEELMASNATKNQKIGLEALKMYNMGIAAGENEEQLLKRINGIVRERLDLDKKKGKSEGDKSLERQARLLQELSGLTGTFNQDLADLYALKQRVNLSDEQYNKLLQELLQKQPVYRDALKAEADAAKDLAKALDEAVKVRAKYLGDLEKTNEKQAEVNQKLADEIVEIVAGKDALAQRVALRLEEQAIQLEIAAQTEYQSDLDERAFNAQMVRVRGLRAQAALMVGKQSAETNRDLEKANEKAAEDALKEWQKTSDQISQSLADALMEGGKKAADYIKDLFRTMVLQPIIKAAVSPAAGAVTGALGFAGPAQAAGGANMLGSFGSIGSAIGSFGGAFGSSFGAGATLTSVGATGTALGASGALLSAGQIASGLGVGLGAVAPYLAAAYAIYAIAKGMDDSGTPHQGSVVGVDMAGISRTLYGDQSRILDNFNQQTDSALRAIGEASTGLLNAVSKAAGGIADFSGVLKFAADNTDASVGGFRIARGGQTVSDFGVLEGDFRRYAVDAQTGLQQYTRDVVSATRGALDQIDLPGWARKQFEALDEDADLQALAGVADAVAKTMEALRGMEAGLRDLGGVFAALAAQGSDALYSVAEMAGGMDALAAATSSYYSAFYSQAERAAQSTDVIAQALADVGLALPDSREAFREVVDGLDVSTEAGRRQFVTMMQVAGAFDEVTKAAEASAAEAKRAADEELQRQRAIANERFGLETQLLQLQGDTVALRERERNALDESNREVYDRITALQDEQAAAEAARQAEAVEAERAKAIAEERAGLELRLLQAQGDTIAIRELERNALNETNRELYDRITALEDERAAAEKAKQAAIELANSQRALYSAISENIGKFLTPQGRTDRQYEEIATSLRAVGVDFTAAQLSEATKQQILDYATAIVTAGNVSFDAAIAIVNAAGALADLKDAAVQADAELERTRIGDALQAIADEFGDLSVVADNVETVSDAYRRNVSELENLENGFNEILGTVGRTIQETLADLIAKQRALQSARASLADAIEESRLSGMTPEARAAALRTQEAALFGQLATSTDPVAVAQRLQSVLIKRIQEEAGIKKRIADGDIDALQQQADLAKQARDAQIDALREQIDAAERLQQLSKDIFQTVSELRFGDLSPMGYEQQLSEARGLFERTLQQATAGDEFAQRSLIGNARAYIEEARAYFASSAEYASIFNAVTGALENLGETGIGLDPQLDALNNQLEALRELNSNQSDVGEILIDTSADMTAGLLAIDAALARREEQANQSVEDQKELARAQISELKTVVDNQKAQLTQQAAIAAALTEELEALNARVQRLLNNDDLTMAAPA